MNDYSTNIFDNLVRTDTEEVQVASIKVPISQAGRYLINNNIKSLFKVVNFNSYRI